jgi:hypothetical protein
LCPPPPTWRRQSGTPWRPWRPPSRLTNQSEGHAGYLRSACCTLPCILIGLLQREHAPGSAHAPPTGSSRPLNGCA